MELNLTLKPMAPRILPLILLSTLPVLAADPKEAPTGPADSVSAPASGARHRPDHADSLFLARSYLNQAHDDYGPGRLDSALVNFERSLAWDRTNAGAWHGLGATLGRMRRHREAQAAFDEALRLRPDYFMAWWHRGCDNAVAGRYDEAISDLRHALAVDSTKRSWPFEDSDWDSLLSDPRLLELTHGPH
jgi:tetratricopeptide (TPR) repeat protein